MARCHIDVGIQWSVPGGEWHCLVHGNPVSTEVVDTGALWRYLGFSQSHQSEERNKSNHIPFGFHEFKHGATINVHPMYCLTYYSS